MSEDYPRYLKAAEIKIEFGLGPRRLKELSQMGYVRTIKFGEKKQATRLYRTQDVIDSLDRMSIGYEPKKQKM